MIAWNEFLFSFMFLDDLNLFTLSRGIVSLNDQVPGALFDETFLIATICIILFLILKNFSIRTYFCCIKELIIYGSLINQAIKTLQDNDRGYNTN